MYVGTIGIIHPEIRTARVCAVTGSRFHGRIRDRIIIATDPHRWR